MPSSSSEMSSASANSVLSSGLNEDILHLIFEHFDLHPGSISAPQARIDLLSAGQVCKHFSEPALKALWKILPSIIPLLLLLPSAKVADDQFFLDDLPFTNQGRFERYARHVRNLYMDTPKIEISPLIYQRIQNIFDSALLPSLKEIYMPDWNNSVNLALVKPLASGTSFNSLSLNDRAISDPDFFIPFLTLLATKSPQLHSLALNGTGDASLEPVFRFSNLRRLEIRLSRTYLCPQTFRRLGSLENLLDLTVDVSASGPSPSLHTLLPIPLPSYYGMLRKLHIIGAPSSISGVLNYIRLPCLTNLVIDELSGNTIVDPKPFWVSCFQQLSLSQAIEDMEINQCERWNPNHSLSNSWLDPLLDLKNMKSLVINGSSLSGSDQDFCRLAHSFHKLQKLILPPKHHSHGRTLACLPYFSQECPDLQEIKISVSHDILENLHAIQELPDTHCRNPQHPLKGLHINSEFGEIQMVHSIQVAQFLNLYFPNLLILEYYEPYPSWASYYPGSTEASTWEGIQLIRIALQTARIDAIFQTRSEMEYNPLEKKVDHA